MNTSVSWLITFCCSGSFLSFSIWFFLPAQSSNTLSFNCHITHHTTILHRGVALEYYFFEALSEGLTFLSLALSQWFVTEVYTEPFLFTYFSIPAFCPWRLPKVNRMSPVLMVLQVNVSRYIQHNCTPMQAKGVLSPCGVLQNCVVTNTSFYFIATVTIAPKKNKHEGSILPFISSEPIVLTTPFGYFFFKDTYLWTRLFFFLFLCYWDFSSILTHYAHLWKNNSTGQEVLFNCSYKTPSF